MNFIDSSVVTFCRLIAIGIRLFHLGSAQTWPGEIAIRLRPQILTSFSFTQVQIIVIAGTNGKTTTAKMTETILKKTGKMIKRNASGANLENGIVSLFISDTTSDGRLRSDIYILEVDEGAFPAIISKVHPTTIVLLDLFRDQLDRYGEVDAIVSKWKQSLQHIAAKTFICANADDPQIAYIADRISADISYFGLEDNAFYLSTIDHATDSIYCPRCGQRLTYAGVYFSHLGKWACGKCGFTHPEVSLGAGLVVSPLEGVYNIYNTLASTLIGRHFGLSDVMIAEQLLIFTPAFGRMESVRYHGKHVMILLSKNPTGFNESLRTIIRSEKQGPVLLVLNDRIPDGTDVSWIWDVDFEMLDGKSRDMDIVVSGDRAYDLGVRIQYAMGRQHQPHITVLPDLQKAIDTAVDAAKIAETVWMLATYSAMLDIRKIVTGRKIL